jgi:hypothetical protein
MTDWDNPAALQLEILALRYQLNVVKRSRPPRLRFTDAVRPNYPSSSSNPRPCRAITCGLYWNGKNHDAARSCESADENMVATFA